MEGTKEPTDSRLYKVVFVGDVSSGKTTLYKCMFNDQTYVQVDPVRTLHVCDTNEVIPKDFDTASVVVICHNLTEQTSDGHLDLIIGMVLLTNDASKVIVVGTHSDKTDLLPVITHRKGCQYIHVSSKTRHNISSCYDLILSKCV